MKVLGIIVEYNPFHNGHLYHLQQSKQITGADHVVAIMSGDYTQRGEPACIDKFARTKMALSCGVDLVLELPTPFSSSSAEFFSYSTVKILDSINIITDLCFGAETNNLDLLSEIADTLINESDDFKTNIKNALSEGNSYPKSRNIALTKQFVNHISADNFNKIINSSNNILGIEYLKSLKKLHSSIKPHLTQRVLVNYDSETIVENITSATNIRKITKEKNYETLKKVMPHSAYQVFMEEVAKNNGIRELNDFSDILQYKLKTTNTSKLTEIFGMNEGIENRLLKCANNNYYINNLISELKTKRYTYTALQRLILHTVLDIKKDTIENVLKSGLYARVLGFRKESNHLLSLLEEKSKIPVITNINNVTKNSKSDIWLHNELICTDVYNLINHNEKLRYSGQELIQKMVVI
ncbi:MAG TPA: nucleotidyltransferase [Clostridiales bacterium]|nr:MAG: hypothetical protein A2Y22_02455 [Clostridiales bacterium GWD2_32_59]HAN10378.1 nucleotidyltransferase [Clostridiales bacterium]